MADAFRPRFVDLVRNYTSTIGTGNFVLGEAVTGYRSFATEIQAGDSFYYSVAGIDKPAEFEVGRGTMQPDGTISREPLNGAPTDFSSGFKSVALVAAAEWHEAVHAGSVLAPTSVNGRQELAQLADRTKAVFLFEKRREGLFLFDPSNRSAEVAADAMQGVYVAPRSDPSGASGAWVRCMDGPVMAAWFGVQGDGATDDYATAQAALDFAGASENKHVRFGRGTYNLSQNLSVPNEVIVEGEGRATVLRAISATYPNAIKVEDRGDFVIRNLKLTPFSSGINRFAPYLVFCSNARIENIWVDGQTDGSGPGLLDCDDCIVDGVRFNGSPYRNGYGAHLVGCVRCSVVDSTASDCRFGFVIIGQDVSPDSTRKTAETFGNSIQNCHVTRHRGHAFDINAAVGTQIVGCSASDYVGIDEHVAFQSKGGSGNDAGVNTGTTSNIFTGCTARNCPSGFGGQASAHAVFSGCTAINVSNYGFLLNGISNSRFVACSVREFGLAGIWLNNASSNSFDDIGLETSTATAKGILMDVSSGACNSNNFDNVTTASVLSAFVDIPSGANNNRFGMGCRSNRQAISDASGTTLWPLRVHTATFNTNSVANAFSSEYLHRGMQVAAARFSCTITITGDSPQIIAGNIGASSRIVALQPITAVSPGATQSLTINPANGGLMDPGAVMQASVAIASSSGQGFVTFEGLPQL
jgi:hypothetical protein